MNQNRQVVRLLKRAKRIISTPSRWHQGYFAVTKGGTRCDPDSPRAVKWCMIGALLKAAPGRHDALGCSDYGLARSFLSQALPRYGNSIVEWQDRRVRKHSQVMAVFERAIALAEKQ